MRGSLLGRYLLAGVCTAVLICAVPAVAQFPDIRQMSGTPLPSPEMPDGTVSVRVVRESLANNLTDVPVTLTGGPTPQAATTDAQGRAIFSGVPAGTTISAVVALASGERVESRTFTMPASGGIRLILAVGLDAGAASPAPEGASPDGGPVAPGAAASTSLADAIPGRVVLGSQTRTIVEIIDGALEVFHVFELANIADRPVDVGAPLEFSLPPEASTVTLLEGSSSQARVFERKLVVAGPFPPGRTMVQVAYRLPYSGPTMSLGVVLPVPMIQTNLIVRLLGDTTVVLPTLSQSRVAQAEGRTYWTATGQGLNAGDTLTVALSGLPYHSPWPAYSALILAAAVVAVGLWGAARRVDPSVRVADLEGRKARLLAEVRRLDSAAAPSPGDAPRRATLLQELEGLYVLLDAERDRQPSRADVAPSV